ncbi:proton extrusion protein PcxA [Kamptonema formosum]|uniref:proton extrusion protein PcxA n=1 Tax=Kamptonema formosum TaxID=331992 RepID=UPI0003455A16|nr:proton extrusion protein PcxA [Oscillatoria sp. PCC 10802]
MKKPQFTNIQGYFRDASKWFSATPERALEEAYNAALTIKSIEDQHFNGQKISAETAHYSESVIQYFEGQLTKYLNIARLNLSAFKISHSLLTTTKLGQPKEFSIDSSESFQDSTNIVLREKASITLEKLTFIDGVLAKYTSPVPVTYPPSSPSLLVAYSQSEQPSQSGYLSQNSTVPYSAEKFAKMSESISDKTGFLPRSILRTVQKLKKDLDPKAEEEVIQNFRNSKNKTVISLRFILLLVLIPLLTQQLSKNFLVGPVVDHFREESSAEIFINEDFEKEAFEDLARFEEQLKFKILIGAAPHLSTEELEERVKHKAEEIAEEYRAEGNSAIKNVFADLISAAVFATVVFTSKREIAILKSFMDEIIYGLSDSAKAFIIILLTDIFVGFHSPHGWEVILEGISRHLGLPESRDFNFLFIATFPVILDTIFKYWIFRYLSRISPSAVATYRNMNE